MDETERGPLFERIVTEDVPLPRAPLARVIGQLRFPTLSAFADTAADAFVSAVSQSYPFLEQGLEQSLTFNVGQQSVQQVQTASGRIWRLRSEDGQSVVALANGALTLETAAYPGRGAFCDQLVDLADALQGAVRVPAYQRIAVRYTNRLAGPDTLGALTDLIHPEFLGLVGVPKADRLRLAYSMSQSLLVLDDGGR
ncbi:TIGR04255 family protein, partial [Streptomyces albidoflavus]